jgi:hypothetical protein
LSSNVRYPADTVQIHWDTGESREGLWHQQLSAGYSLQSPSPLGELPQTSLSLVTFHPKSPFHISSSIVVALFLWPSFHTIQHDRPRSNVCLCHSDVDLPQTYPNQSSQTCLQDQKRLLVFVSEPPHLFVDVAFQTQRSNLYSSPANSDLTILFAVARPYGT